MSRRDARQDTPRDGTPPSDPPGAHDETDGADFIRQRVRRDVTSGKVGSVVTRFPPEPNGYLHIGHAKSICLNFGVADEFDGTTYLRFDDTNPLKENTDFVRAIQRDVRWLGFNWHDDPTFASDYFEQLYGYALRLIEDGLAYVCSLSAEQIREYRGTLTEPGRDSPYRDRSIDENRELFERMRNGDFADGEHVLRARIDMQAANVNMRDPVLYRIRHAQHHRTGDAWVIYPTYDFTHCVCDALEGVTHSLCTLEFADHRPLYDWVLESIQSNVRPPQIEFSRLNLEYTVMSKRVLNELVAERIVDGWDDPRLPTLAGMRRRGVPPEAIRDFCARIGVTRQDNVVELALFDFCVRQFLESRVPRAMAVLEPLRVILTNYPEQAHDALSGPWHPKADQGARELPFSRELFIERSDFAEAPPKGFKRLTPGGIVRLRYAYIIRCDDVERDASGNIVALHCRYEPASRSGNDTSGLKPKGVIHWVDASAEPVRVRAYEPLFVHPTPSGTDWRNHLNPNSLIEYDARVEPAVVEQNIERLQFERQGYFSADPELPRTFNRIVGLRDGYQKK